MQLLGSDIDTGQLAIRLADYVGVPAVTDYLTQCVHQSCELVAAEASDATGVPQAVAERAVLETAAELYHRRNAPNGVKSFGDLDGAGVIRVARDPLVAARPLLAPYKPLAIS